MASSRHGPAGQLEGHVCFDFGTSHSCISSTAARKTELDLESAKSKIRVFDQYPSIPSHGRPDPTTNLYFDDSGIVLTGFELATDPRFDGSHNYDVSRFVKYAKLLAHEPNGGDARYVFDSLRSQVEQLGKTPAEILEFFAENFYNDILPLLRHQNDWEDGMNIRLTLTVPAGWSKSEHAALLNGFQKHGSKHGIDDFMLVTEPQAQLLWHAREKETRGEPFQRGDIVVVMDLGGGTTCMEPFQITRIDGSELIPLGENISICNGMQLVSSQFGEMVRARLQNVDLPQNFNIEHAIRKAISSFECRKDTFGLWSVDEIHIYIEGLKENKKRRFLKDKMLFNHNEIKSLFDHFFKHTLREIKSISRGKSVTELYFAGGGANNPYLWQELKNTFAAEVSHGLRLVRQQKTKFAVSNGGVIASLHASMGHDILSEIVAQKVQCIFILADYTNDLDIRYGESLKHFTLSGEGDQEYYCLLEHFVEKNELISSKNSVQHRRTFRDSRFGGLHHRLLQWKDLKIGKGGTEIKDILVIIDQCIDTLERHDDGETFVNAILNEQGIIIGFRDLAGDQISGASISHELRWTLDLHEDYYKSIRYKDARGRWQVRVDYRLILQVNDLGETIYVAEVHLAEKPKWTKQFNRPKPKIVKRRFPATVRPVEDAGLKVTQMTKTCAATYTIPHQDKAGVSVPSTMLFPETQHSMTQEQVSATIIQSNTLIGVQSSHNESLTIPGIYSLRDRTASSSSSGRQFNTPTTQALAGKALEVLNASRGNASDFEREQQVREERSAKRHRSWTALNDPQSDDSIPSSALSLRRTHRGPWPADRGGLKEPVQRKKRKCRDNQRRGCYTDIDPDMIAILDEFEG